MKPRMGVFSIVCVLAGMLAAPAGAPAQSSFSTQYTPNIGTAGSFATGGSDKRSDGDPGAAGTNAGTTNAGTTNAGSAAGTTNAGRAAGNATGGGESLPFTGYPLTPLVALTAALLAAGLTLRMLAPTLDRRHA